VTINRKTRNAEPDIGTDGSNLTRQNQRVDGYGSGFGPPRLSRSGFWTVLEPNRPVFAGQTRTAGRLPGPIADTALCAILVHMVGFLKIAYGRSWISQRLSWMNRGEEVGLNISKTSVQIYMR